uniref:Splicing factor 3b subunit 2 n=1 Tax=Apteryx owenii TaxID=8824 RepID=A0A8B9PTV2_APTOW
MCLSWSVAGHPWAPPAWWETHGTSLGTHGHPWAPPCPPALPCTRRPPVARGHAPMGPPSSHIWAPLCARWGHPQPPPRCCCAPPNPGVAPKVGEGGCQHQRVPGVTLTPPPAPFRQSQHPFGDKVKEQELLEQQKRAAVLLEQERQQELAKLAPAVPRPPPDVGPLGARPPLAPRGSAPVGAPMPGMPMGAPRPRGPPPPPGEESREPDDSTVGPKIPQALEKILQLKEIRQEELITVPADDEMETDSRASLSVSASETEDDAVLSKKERNRKRRNRKKKKRARVTRDGATQSARDSPASAEATATDVEIEYITEEPEIYDPNFIFFKRIFDAFKLTDDVKKDKEKEPDKADRQENATVPKKKGFEDGQKGSEDDSSEDEQEKKPEVPKLSKKKLRRMNRFTVAELKQLVARPDVVEMHDVTAQDPKLLVHLKATRNSVPVPRHWCFKRKYLQGKRGIEKPPFELPDFIKRTGIQEMREALQEKEEQKTMKSKMREKVRPKMGKIDIDYQKLHDAFFKWQTKPKLTIHGLNWALSPLGVHGGLNWALSPLGAPGAPNWGSVPSGCPPRSTHLGVGSPSGHLPGCSPRSPHPR